MMRKSATLLLLLMASAARAQDTSSPEYVEARARLQEGKTLYGQGNIDGARLKFEQACAVLKTPACERALGLAQFYTKRYLEALGNLQRALEDRELDTVQRKQVTDLMQQAYDKTGHVEVHAPAGGRVRIDDTTDAGNAPLRETVHVTVGSHTISVTVDQKTERKTLECAEGKIIKVDFSDVFPSSHIDDTHPPITEEHAKWFPPPNGALAFGIIGLVGVGVGIGFGVASSSANDENVTRGATAGGVCSANPTAQVCVDGKNTRDAQQLDAMLSVVGYGVGAAALVTAVVWWLVAPRKVIIEHKAMLVPTASPHSAGASFTISF